MAIDRAAKRVADLMTHDPVMIDPDEDAAEAEELLSTYRITGLPVVHDGELVGVISQLDIMEARASEIIGVNWERLRVRHLMTSPAVTVHSEATVTHAAHLMLSRHIHRLVVVGDDGSPIGVVTPLDLLRVLVEAEAAVS